MSLLSAPSLLRISAVGLGTIGALYLFAPKKIFAMYGFEVTHVNEQHVLKSPYIGLFLGFSTLFLLGAKYPELTKPALIAEFVLMLGFFSGRLASMYIDGKPHYSGPQKTDSRLRWNQS